MTIFEHYSTKSYNHLKARCTGDTCRLEKQTMDGDSRQYNVLSLMTRDTAPSMYTIIKRANSITQQINTKANQINANRVI